LLFVVANTVRESIRLIVPVAAGAVMFGNTTKDRWCQHFWNTDAAHALRTIEMK
jgi:hypothetical protein